jgi:uncharacterized protein YlxW (UPF0749 family)
MSVFLPRLSQTIVAVMFTVCLTIGRYMQPVVVERDRHVIAELASEQGRTAALQSQVNALQAQLQTLTVQLQEARTDVCLDEWKHVHIVRRTKRTTDHVPRPSTTARRPSPCAREASLKSRPS